MSKEVCGASRPALSRKSLPRPALALGLLLLAVACGQKGPSDGDDGGVEDLANGSADFSGPGPDGASSPDLATKPDGGGGGDMAAASVCSSNSRWTRGDIGNAQMHPGMACITCHQNKVRAPKFTIAGTVYRTVHEPDDCNGGTTNGGAVTIEITDANNKVTTLTASATSGNFSTLATIATPYSAVVKQGGRSSAMKAKQTSGDCNSCHSEFGIQGGAPGRIVIP